MQYGQNIIIVIVIIIIFVATSTDQREITTGLEETHRLSVLVLFAFRTIRRVHRARQ